MFFSTQGKENSKFTGGELWKSELWEDPGRAAQRYKLIW